MQAYWQNLKIVKGPFLTKSAALTIISLLLHIHFGFLTNENTSKTTLTTFHISIKLKSFATIMVKNINGA